MMIRITSVAVVLVFGAAIGWLLADHWSDSERPEPDVAPGSIAPAAAIGQPRFQQDISPLAAPRPAPVQSNGHEPANAEVPAGNALAGMRTRLNQETVQRRLLERRVQELADRLARLENVSPPSATRPRPATSSGIGSEDVSGDPETRARAREARFLAVGFDKEQEKELTHRMHQMEMERLYLRDRARREGWLRTPEFRQAAGELRDELRNEMDEDIYDRFLYASEQDNRVWVDRVLESSPAQTIGLRAGDLIVGYDGRRVFSYRDIRTATADGEAGDPVALRIERNGEVLDLEIPRGPMGVHLESNSVKP